VDRGCRICDESTPLQVIPRYFEDYEVGTARSSAGRTITETDIVLHAGPTGDFYPYHMDAEWVKTQPFGQRFAHGTLLIAVAMGMTCGEINPLGISYGYERIRFVQPVHIGDTLTVTLEVAAKREDLKRPAYGFVEEEVVATRQGGDVVMALRHLLLVARRPSLDTHAGARR
jgi:acyl dehydratase